MNPGAPQAPEAGESPAGTGTGRLEKAIWAGLIIVLVTVTVAGALSLLRSRVTSAAASPEVLGELPEFLLTSSDLTSVGRDDLLGHPWIADFIFTRCTGMCPLLSSRMLDIQKVLESSEEGAGYDGVKLVSFSVDPEYDSPEVLQAYAGWQGADKDRWLFLTGDWASMRKLVGEGFRLNVSKAESGLVPVGELVTHSDRLVLVDGKGRIRGYYHGTEEGSTKAILEDLDRID
jgi:protein SCO1/2